MKSIIIKERKKKKRDNLMAECESAAKLPIAFSESAKLLYNIYGFVLRSNFFFLMIFIRYTALLTFVELRLASKSY